MAVNKLNGGYEGCFDRGARVIVNNNFSDVSLCTTELDVTSSTTLANVTGMVTGTLDPGTYKFKIELDTVCTANNGSKFAFKQGTASMITSINYVSKAFTASAVAATKGSTTTDQALLLDNASAVVIAADITGVVVIGTAGTLQLQAAEHTSHADTFSVFVNSKMQFERITIG